MGGDPAVRRLVDRFYELMDTLPEARVIREMHPADLTESRDKLYEFLSGWLGGPPLYWERRGHPMLRRRHFPFAIDRSAAAQWMRCMGLAMEELIDDPGLRMQLTIAFGNVADHMRNQPEAAE
ncbi:MAG: group II truncated hemoglobin [Alphaproteobacteria bacterium]|nr:group II truncated hemoglobin [Alphaproteobacteria bacterium]